MISETLHLTPPETSDIPPVSKSFPELPLSREINFEPKKHEYVKREDGIYIKFYGPMSSGMEYFIEREKAHNKRIVEIEKKFQEEVLHARGFSTESLGPHYFFPTITTASAEEPVSIAEVEPIE